eukprot:TRINITY_DN27678_c0_g1_i1.p1 TRINITY_DN27678_c0_g1~~TRINITY_DN27678_c0_g1_i1.p1  ORF type:complete len:307 (+),score=31.86 TRINITY_DN27678_c0_g1_i1:132-1052(+)
MAALMGALRMALHMAKGPPQKGDVVGPMPTVAMDFVMTVTVLLASLLALHAVISIADTEYLSKRDALVALSWLGPLVTILGFISSLPFIWDAVWRPEANQDFPAIGFRLQALVNALCICIGLEILNSTVVLVNMFGLGMQVLYLACLHYVRFPNSKWLRFTLRHAALSCGIILLTSCFELYVVGNAMFFANILLTILPPFLKLGPCLRTRGAVMSFSLWLSVFNVGNNGVWTMYAVLTNDVLLLMPCVCGYLICVLQILVVYWCAGSLPFDLSFILFCYGQGPRTVTKLAHEEASTVVEMKALSTA